LQGAPVGPSYAAVVNLSSTFFLLLLKDFDYVVTVCGHANETCPRAKLGKAKVIHVGFDDPPQLALNEPDEERALGHYRRVRDEIRHFVSTIPESLVSS